MRLAGVMATAGVILCGAAGPSQAELAFASDRGGSFDIYRMHDDGTGLAPFAEHGIRVLGVDPAPGPAATARERGIETRRGFFGTRMAHALEAEGIRADVLLARNNQTNFVNALKLIDLTTSAQQPPEPLLAEPAALAWLSELAQPTTNARPAQNNAAAEAVDQVLAAYWPE